MQGKLEIDDLRQEIGELQDQNPTLKEDEAFVGFFQEWVPEHDVPDGMSTN